MSKDTFRERLSAQERELRAKDIELRFGLCEDYLFRLVSHPDFTTVARQIGLGGNARNLFTRYLKRADTVLSKLPELERMLNLNLPGGNDRFLRGYLDFIHCELGSQAYVAYLSGEWGEEIVRAVSLAQRRHLVPERPKTISEQVPSVRFEPRSAYSGYLNR